MQATMTRPRASQNAFFAHTGVPLGPLPMHAPGPEELVPYPVIADGNELSAEGYIDLDDILAARCASL
jgi:hypothetical protein